MSFWKRLILPFSGLIALCGCSGVDLLNLTIPRTGYTVHHDIAYGEKSRQKLDVYVPDVLASGHPVVVFFYGGRWQSGSKADYLFVGQAFASKGFITVLADYRLYPQVYFPSFMEDGANAFVWAHNHIQEYGGNPENIFVSGHSSGSYIAILLALDGHYLGQAGGKQSWIKGAMGFAGPYDFLPFTDDDVKAIFSKAADADTQPINHVMPGAPPMLLMTGDKDTSVYPRNTIHLAAKLRSSGDEVTEKIYPGIGHVGIILSVAKGFRSKSPALEDAAAFVRQHTKD